MASLPSTIQKHYAMILQQGGRGIYVEVSRETPTEGNQKLQLGDEVEVQALGEVGGYAPSLIPKNIRKIGHPGMPVPTSIKASEISDERLENVYGTVQARAIKGTHDDGSGAGPAGMEVQLEEGNIHFTGMIFNATPDQIKNWIGSETRDHWSVWQYPQWAWSTDGLACCSSTTYHKWRVVQPAQKKLGFDHPTEN